MKIQNALLVGSNDEIGEGFPKEDGAMLVERRHANRVADVLKFDEIARFRASEVHR